MPAWDTILYPACLPACAVRTCLLHAFSALPHLLTLWVAYFPPPYYGRAPPATPAAAAALPATATHSLFLPGLSHFNSAAAGFRVLLPPPSACNAYWRLRTSHLLHLAPLPTHLRWFAGLCVRLHRAAHRTFLLTPFHNMPNPAILLHAHLPPLLHACFSRFMVHCYTAPARQQHAAAAVAPNAPAPAALPCMRNAMPHTNSPTFSSAGFAGALRYLPPAFGSTPACHHLPPACHLLPPLHACCHCYLRTFLLLPAHFLGSAATAPRFSCYHFCHAATCCTRCPSACPAARTPLCTTYSHIPSMHRTTAPYHTTTTYFSPYSNICSVLKHLHLLPLVACFPITVLRFHCLAHAFTFYTATHLISHLYPACHPTYTQKHPSACTLWFTIPAMPAFSTVLHEPTVLTIRAAFACHFSAWVRRMPAIFWCLRAPPCTLPPACVLPAACQLLPRAFCLPITALHGSHGSAGFAPCLPPSLGAHWVPYRFPVFLHGSHLCLPYLCRIHLTAFGHLHLLPLLPTTAGSHLTTLSHCTAVPACLPLHLHCLLPAWFCLLFPALPHLTFILPACALPPAASFHHGFYLQCIPPPLLHSFTVMGQAFLFPLTILLIPHHIPTVMGIYSPSPTTHLPLTWDGNSWVWVSRHLPVFYHTSPPYLAVAVTRFPTHHHHTWLYTPPHYLHATISPHLPPHNDGRW